MKKKISLNYVCKPSEDVVTREIHGEFILIPVASGIADMEDEIFSLNKTGRAIWNKLDGKSTLKQLVDSLIKDFNGGPDEIKKDTLGLIAELLKRKMVSVLK